MVPAYPSITRLFGIELEFFLVDKEGKLSNKSDSIIKPLKNKLSDSNVVKESGKSMLELTSFPHRSSREVFSGFFKDFETLLYEVDVNDLNLFHYGTYPGINKTEQRQNKRYVSKSKLLGEKYWPIAQKCIGFHFHYTLPRNSYNTNIKFFYPDIKKVQQDKVVNLHNLYIGLDPAITTLMQSSPYLDGKYYGKNSRVQVYRGDSNFEHKSQLYIDEPEFGILNDYSPDFTTLANRIKARSNTWKQKLRYHNYTLKEFAKDGKASFLDSSWKPVKISSHGTIESRSADMNSLKKVVALSSLLKSLSQYVQNNKITIKPSEIGNDEPFKLEGKTLHLPDYNYLRNELQVKGALFGFDDKEVLKYCRRLLRLMKQVIPIERRAPLRTFSRIISEEKTTSDDIISFVKKKQGDSSYIDEETAQELAIKSSEKIYKDLILTKKMCDTNLIF